MSACSLSTILASSWTADTADKQATADLSNFAYVRLRHLTLTLGARRKTPLHKRTRLRQIGLRIQRRRLHPGVPEQLLRDRQRRRIINDQRARVAVSEPVRRCRTQHRQRHAVSGCDEGFRRTKDCLDFVVKATVTERPAV